MDIKISFNEQDKNKTVCLAVIFNHRYDDNITKLKSIYEERFHKIFFLVPFYEGNVENVIPVYECSYQFPGFLIQAYDKLAEAGADYYFFIGDDLILSPYINENNVLTLLKMNGKEVFTTDIRPLNSEEGGGIRWPHAGFSSVPFFKGQTRWKGSIPDYASALEKFHSFFGRKYEEEYGRDFFGRDFDVNNLEKEDEIRIFIQRNGGNLSIPYPMACGYSDIFIIKREKLFSIARLCGVFSAMNMFAEISFPTSLVLSVDREKINFLNDTKFQGIVEWGAERENTEKKYQCKLKLLYNNWEVQNLFVHPVKLSKWEL